MQHALRVIGCFFLWVVLSGSAVWATLALYYAGEGSGSGLRLLLALLFVLLFLLIVFKSVRSRYGWRWKASYGVLWFLVLVWYFTLQPSNERDWQSDVAVLPYVTVDGTLVTVHNIRNFEYRSENDYTPRYYDRTFDAEQLASVDLIASYWMGPSIAHTFLSFGFESGDHLAISIETRKEKGESYSTVRGFFREYELYYVVADERDVIGLRTDIRNDPPEDVYLYKLKGPGEYGRQLFWEYIRQINLLKETPAFYNSLTTNCTTNIWFNSFVNATYLPFDWKIIVSGYLPQYLYDQGRLETYGLTFEALKRRSYINKRTKSDGNENEFSRHIRTVR